MSSKNARSWLHGWMGQDRGSKARAWGIGHGRWAVGFLDCFSDSASRCTPFMSERVLILFSRIPLMIAYNSRQNKELVAACDREQCFARTSYHAQDPDNYIGKVSIIKYSIRATDIRRIH